LGIRSGLGAACMSVGAALRWSAVRSLGPSFVTELREGPLVESGPYRWLRHPSETGNIAVALGACLLLGSWRAMAPFGGAFFLICWRVRREDVFMRCIHGRRFERYEARVGGLLPRPSRGLSKGADPLDLDLAQAITFATGGASHREPIGSDMPVQELDGLDV